MIKLVEKKVEENKTYRKTCWTCGATFEFEKNDAYVGTYGCYYITCPGCHSDVDVDEIEPLELDENNIQFPTHFYKFGTKNGGVDIEDEEIQQWVRKCLRKIKQNDNAPFWIAGSGNTQVIVLNYDDMYEVIVAKNYYDCDIYKDTN